MEERQRILVSGAFQSGVSNSHPVQLLALCIASSIKNNVSDQIFDFRAPLSELRVLLPKETSLLRWNKTKEHVQKSISSVINNANDNMSEEERDIGSIIPGLDDEAATRCIALAHRCTYGALSLTHRSIRELIQTGYIYDLRLRLGIMESWIYMFANRDSSWRAFDPECGRWMRLPPCQTDYAFIHSDKESLSAGTHLLWMGKEIPDYIVFRYELLTNTWHRGPSMNQARCLFASASCGEYAFVAGGNHDGTVLQSVEMYNSVHKRWEILPDMPNVRQKASGCFMDGKFYVIGGRDESRQKLTSGEEYDPSNGKWRTIKNMFEGPANEGRMESSPPLVAVVGNRLYYLDSSVNELKLYNKVSNSWTTLGPVPVRADFNNGWGLAFKAVGEELYVIGGYRHPQMFPDGTAIFSWRPQRDGGAPNWHLVLHLHPQAGSFLYNCAVMTC